MVEMYSNKIEEILLDLEDGHTHLAGGSAVGMVISIINSLIKYIANLTLGKKKYEDVQEKIQEILNNAEFLKKDAMNVIDEDKTILENILNSYKLRKENEDIYQKSLKDAVDFGIEVLNIAFKTLKISDEISKVGNKMLESDFKICKYYSYASIQASMENIKINIKEINDITYKNNVEEKYKKILKDAELLV